MGDEDVIPAAASAADDAADVWLSESDDDDTGLGIWGFVFRFRPPTTTGNCGCVDGAGLPWSSLSEELVLLMLLVPLLDLSPRAGQLAMRVDSAANTVERGSDGNKVIATATSMAGVVHAEGGGVRTTTFMALLAFNEGGVCCNA